jgi:hypothetical protein
VLPCLPREWSAVVATPGLRPFQALAHAMAALVAGDPDAVRQLLRFDNADTVVAIFRAFRERHGHVLVVLDQFEELFTLSDAAVQTAFASLLGRLVLEADCHVLLSLRDDFLLRCNAHEALTPAFSDLTPLDALTPSALRRALVQLALACGYQFEDESLADEMVAAVSGERGAAAAGVCGSPPLGTTRSRARSADAPGVQGDRRRRRRARASRRSHARSHRAVARADRQRAVPPSGHSRRHSRGETARQTAR